MSDVEALKRAVEPEIQALIKHPFNQAMLDESLTTEQYTYYCVQDDFYLDGYARALALIAAKLPQRKHMTAFLRFALEAIDHEHALHQFQIDREQKMASAWQQLGMSDAGEQYTDFLLAHASHSAVQSGVASVLPCFYVYQRVGQAMRDSSHYHAAHRYREWIDVYAGEEFSEASDQAFSVLVNCVEGAVIGKRLLDVFKRGVALEGVFWSSALHPQPH